MIRQVILSTSTNPYFNLAMEEFIVRTIDLAAKDILLIYINQPSIILGKNQNIYKEINLKYLLNSPYKICRRLSGGGTVVHDLGNINFAFFKKYNLAEVNKYQDSVGFISNSIQQLGINTFVNQRNAIFLPNGSKIGGSAQFSSKNGILSHLTLLFKADLAQINQILKANTYLIDTKASNSVPSTIDNLSQFTSMDQMDFVNWIVEKYEFEQKTDEFSLDIEAINTLQKDKYEQLEFIFDSSGTATITIDPIEIQLINGRIEAIKGLENDTNYIGKRLQFEEISMQDPLWTYFDL